MTDIGENTIFTKWEKERDSYWEEKDDRYPCILEYKFDTPADMMKLLKIYIEDERMLKMLVADSFKKRNEVQAERLDANDEKPEDVSLPEYVYVF